MSAPLWPAGHLPRKGGDRQLQLLRLSCNAGNLPKADESTISSLAGEMSGRTEGGAVPPAFRGKSSVPAS
ncbi:hypothetical protein A9K65_015965 [Mesorhizobium sp. WSM1497]|nr:hypothetical protein A9K65_015965 [Mesorhizobium sp. WSM1497]